MSDKREMSVDPLSDFFKLIYHDKHTHLHLHFTGLRYPREVLQSLLISLAFNFITIIIFRRRGAVALMNVTARPCCVAVVG